MIKLLIGLIFCISIAATNALAEDTVSTPAPEPQKVAGVELKYPGEMPPDIMGLIPIHKGDPLSGKAVRESIRLLYLKGIFENVIVEGTDTPEGVVLKYNLIPRLRITGIDVDGHDFVSKKKILEKLFFKEGDFVDAGLIKKSRQAILKLYGDEGFRTANAEISVSKKSELLATIDVNVVEGPPTLVKEIRLTGELTLPEKDLRGELEIETGERLRKEDLDKSVSDLTAYYAKKDFVKADVQPEVKYLDDEAVVELKVQSGPKLLVSFEGNNNVSSKKLKKALTFWEDRDISDESVQENLDKLISYYRQQGYYFAAVTSRTEETISPPMVSVKFVVYEGARSKLARIILDGNKEVSTGDIMDTSGLKASSWYKDRRITDEDVASAVERIKNLYDSRGYLKAEVTAEPIAFNEPKTEASVKIDVREGPRTYVRETEISGNKGISTDRILQAVRQETGKPYSPQQVREDQNSVLNLYSQNGYINATVDVDKKFTGDGKGLVLTYKISEGFPVRIGRIILRGNEDTKDKVVMRELLIKPGDTFDLERILKSQQRIFKLGFFSTVRIQPVEPEKPEPVKDILVNVKERPAGAVEFGGGYGDFDGFRGFAEVSYRNLFGLGHRVMLRGEGSQKQYKAILGYRWPWFLDYKWDLTANLVQLDGRKVNYSIRDTLGSVGLTKTFGDNVTASLVYQYERLKLFDVSAGAVLAPEDRKRSSLASITPSLAVDFRDNPFNPTTGSVHGLQVKWATSTLGSASSFLKTTLQTSWFFPVYKGVVIALSARGGITHSFANTLNIPISERFFLGGASSMRGFKLDSVGPRSTTTNPETGSVAGGDTMVVFNNEVRVPLPYGFGFVTFLDAGNVWLRNKNVEGVTVLPIGEGGLRYGAGVGLRYDTPVGPIRLDYGFKISKKLPGEAGSVLHFSIGQAF